MKTSRRRHILFRIHSSGDIPQGDIIIQILRENLLSLFGEIVVADSKLYLEEFDDAKGRGVIQCDAKTMKEVLAAAAMMYEIGKNKVSFEPVKTSGTLKTLKPKLNDD
ncbi:MAG: hypothetical protein BAJATHORv1_20551 [Candidatus Thorarchaeota archaeon]|nr:MAG: hypothetical protein BAJATHORv1_20551 [Candidatus Thorarchaeota archaeon]